MVRADWESSDVYFFNPEIAKIELASLTKTMAHLMGPVHSLVIDNRYRSCKPDNLVFVIIEPACNSYVIYKSIRIKGRFIRRMTRFQPKVPQKCHSDAKLVDLISSRLEKTINTKGGEVYFFVNLPDNDALAYYNRIYDYISSYESLFEQKLFRETRIQSLPYGLYGLIKQKKSSKTILSKSKYKKFVSFQSRANLHFLAITLKGKLREYEDHFINGLASNYSVQPDNPNLFILYIFANLKQHGMYSEEITTARLHFFTLLIRFIFNKANFRSEFQEILRRTSSKDKDRLLFSFRDLIERNKASMKEIGLYYLKEIITIDDFSKMIVKPLSTFFLQSMFINNNFITVFIEILLNNFDNLAKIIFSEDMLPLCDVSSLRNTLLNDSLRNLISKSRTFAKILQNGNLSNSVESGLLDIKDKCEAFLKAKQVKVECVPPFIVSEIQKMCRLKFRKR